MSKTYNNITDISTTNLYRMLEMDRYQDKDSQTMIKAELAFRNSKLDWNQTDNMNAFNKMTNMWKEDRWKHIEIYLANNLLR